MVSTRSEGKRQSEVSNSIDEKVTESKPVKKSKKETERKQAYGP